VGNARPKFAKARKYFWKNFSFLNFGLGGRKVSGGNFVREIGVAVGAVAEGLIGGMTAAAESNGGASGETEFISGGIDNLEIAFDQDGAVILECNFRWH
jgi:hypothetical protein